MNVCLRLQSALRWLALPLLLASVGGATRLLAESNGTAASPAGKSAKATARTITTAAASGPLVRVATREAPAKARAAVPEAGSSPLHLRDPFREPDDSKPAAALPAPATVGSRPPGIRGLQVDQLRLQGIVREESGHRMTAMVSTATSLSYFLHEGDQIYDGVVSQITPEALCLRRTVSAQFAGSREVVLRLGPGAGGQQ